MERQLTIDGRAVNFRASGAFPLRYKAQTGRDLFVDLDKQADRETFDTEIICAIIWTLAKCADPSIPPIEEWLDTFDVFPVVSVYTSLTDMIYASMRPLKN